MREDAGRDDDDAPAHARVRERGTRAILDALAQGDPDEVLTLQDLVGGLGRRAFGMLLFACSLPAFIPIPIGGAISGPLAMLIGVQLCLSLRRPWLPRFIARRGPHRHTLQRFDRMISPVLQRVERLVRPRLTWVLDARLASLVTGLQMILLGLLLSLPIPLTNYLFGSLMLAFALALIERDGVLMIAAWIGGAIALIAFGALSGELVTQAIKALDAVF
jgi:hypothetical protein